MNADEQPLIPLDQVKWLLRRKKSKTRDYSAIDILPSVAKQKGICALCGIPMRFAGSTSHPLYAVVDHVDGHESDLGFQLLCHAINGLKHDIAAEQFDKFVASQHWQTFVDKWRKKALTSPDDTESLDQLCREMRRTSEYRALDQHKRRSS